MTQRLIGQGITALLLVCALALGGGALSPGLAQELPTPTPPGGRSLAEQVGFADPVFVELEAQGQNTLGESLEFSAFGNAYRLLAIWEMFTGMGMPVSGTALLFQVDGLPVLRWRFDYGAYNGQSPFLYALEAYGAQSPIGLPPGPWLGGETVYFAVASAHGGTAWSNYLIHVYALKPDNTVESAFKGGVIPRGHVVTRIDLIEGGGPVLSVYDIRGEMMMELPNCCGPRHMRYFEWQDGRLVDASARFFGFYFNELGSILYRLTTQPVEEPNEVAARLLELLMIYESTDQREAGWQFAQNLIAQMKASGRLAEGTYIDNVFLPAMRQMAEMNMPFTVPELLGVDMAQMTDWYDEAPKLP